MTKIIINIFILFIFCANGSSIRNRIIGGTDAPEGAYPYQVSLRNKGTHFCGGTIINEYYILTAAHCVIGLKPSSVIIALGSNKLSIGGPPYKVSKIIIHEEYNSNTIKNDIALLRTFYAIAFTDRIQPILLPNSDAQENVKVVLTGWGKTSFPGMISDQLQQLDVFIISNELCKEQQGDKVTETNICSFTQTGEGACHGDSGGPIADQKTNTIVGIVSWGKACAVGKPDVFTRVFSYLNWIVANQE